MLNKNVSVIVIGSVSTDIIASGVKRIVGSGESSKGKELKIGPGGKAVNVSRMISALAGDSIAAVIGKTSMDPFNLWKVPIDALEKDKVNADFVQKVSFEKSKKYPTIALIAVDINGNNQIYGLRGIGDDLFEEDIERASELFKTVQLNNGMLILSLQVPLPTVIYVIEKAKKHNINVLLDPGGVQVDVDYTELFKKEIFLLKPNEHEAKMLTGVTVNDFASAKKAAEILLNDNIKNVFITHGKYGGYLFNSQTKMHIKAPVVAEPGDKDETGCGDQVLAAICAKLLKSDDIVAACKTGLLAGTLQFGKSGIVPVTKEELAKYR